MRETWVVIAVVVIIGVVKGQFDCNSRSNEKSSKELTFHSSRPTPEQPENSVKQKRCSYNLKSSNLRAPDLKLLREQRRTETLCKFCKKSDLRMRSSLCKKCVEDEVLPSKTPYLLKTTVDNLFQKSTKSNDNLKDNKLNSLKTNSNVRESILKLIKTPFVSNSVETTKMTEHTNNMEPRKFKDYNGDNNNILGNFHSKVPPIDFIKEQIEISPTIFENARPKNLKDNKFNSRTTNSNVRESILKLIKTPFVSNSVDTTKMTEHTNTMEPWKFEDYNEDDNNILGNFHSNVPPTDFIKEQTEFSPTIFENSRHKRLKDIRHLSHNDYLQILKEALRSEEDLPKVDIEKRNSIDNEKPVALKKEYLNEILSKHILEMDSESDEDISEIIGTFPSEKLITKRTTVELTTEHSSTSIVDMTTDNKVENKFGNVYRPVFNYKKHPREKLRYINENWIMTKEPPINLPNMDDILQKMALTNSVIPEENSTENILQSNQKEVFTTENSIILSENIEITTTLSPTLTNETKVEQLKQKSVLKDISKQHFLDRQKSPISKSVYKNGKFKYTNENFPPQNWDIFNNTTNTDEMNESENIEITNNTLSPTPTNETKVVQLEQKSVFKDISNQHFLDRQKSPILKSAYENGKFKYTNETFLPQNWDIFNNKTTTEEMNQKVDKYSEENELLEAPYPTEIKKISTRSTKDLPISSQTNKLNNHEIFPTKLSLFQKLKSPFNPDKTKHDIFSRNLNMTPNINQNKYKNVALTLKNNEIKETTQNEDNILNNMKTSQNPILSNKANDLDSVLRNKNGINVHLLENKINLPLILKQNDDGTIQLILDKSKICDCANSTNLDTEKYVYKRKTEDDLTNHPMNVFNILENHRDQSSTHHVNNYYHDQDIKEDLKEKFYEYLINQQLLKVFQSLNIPVDSSAELHSYIDDLEDKEKNKLKQYLLNTISKEYTGTENNINEELFNKKQNEFVQSLLSQQQIEISTQSNRISLQIKSEDDPLPNNLKYDDNSIIKSLIQKEIQKGIENICPICSRPNCVCQNNDRLYFPIDNYSNQGRIIDKRHYLHGTQKENSFNNDDLTQKKYKIVNNFLNWARDIVVHNNTKH